MLLGTQTVHPNKVIDSVIVMAGYIGKTRVSYIREISVITGRHGFLIVKSGLLLKVIAIEVSKTRWEVITGLGSTETEKIPTGFPPVLPPVLPQCHSLPA